MRENQRRNDNTNSPTTVKLIEENAHIKRFKMVHLLFKSIVDLNDFWFSFFMILYVG